MTKALRRLYVAALLFVAASNVLRAVAEIGRGKPVMSWLLSLAIAATLLVVAFRVVRFRPAPPPDNVLPVYTREFEVLRAAHGNMLRCAECDALVLVSADGRMSLFRALLYAFEHHGSPQCRMVTAAEREATARLTPPTPPVVKP